MERHTDRYDAEYARMEWQVSRQRRAEKRRQEEEEDQ